jgi:hypothetical protein
VIRWSDDEWRVVWSFHHLIVDGWSLSRVLGEAVSFYGALRGGTELKIEAPRRYRDYIAWVQRQDLGRAEAFWREALRGFDEATPLPYDGTGSGGESWDYGRETAWIPGGEAEALTMLARVLAEPATMFARAIKAVADKQGGGDVAAEAPAGEPQAEPA